MPLVVVTKDCSSRKGDDRRAAAVPHKLRKAVASVHNTHLSALA